MTSKHRFRNKYSLVLRERDHLPAHVHLIGGGIDLRIDLTTLACIGDCPRDLRNEAVQWVEAHQTELMTEWKKWHP